ncbi:uncharacterized protein K452DRAFT_65901 [Aplosporella prunicola CBS 121167]|uniref:Uncharacterized protein n=1 Tax=Aplosporella prunicola CBS 121167 TaxID=1176127 RepID=A0A6A6BQR6_9PEZI|nr:uncharacterized protein K452DRAFT_65901 [Aplosporella prunicola CBS 121167]KAF2146459.1 hypothetical protein K452DRAFT_65901 [Aplosporella prunicola CBS 121167]
MDWLFFVARGLLGWTTSCVACLVLLTVLLRITPTYSYSCVWGLAVGVMVVMGVVVCVEPMAYDSECVCPSAEDAGTKRY